MNGEHAHLDGREFRDTVWGRISTLERDSAAIKSDIRGIYTGLDDIRAVLVRIQEKQDNTRPNLNALFLVILATCSFLITVGGLSLAPVYRGMNTLEEDLMRYQASVEQYEALNAQMHMDLRNSLTLMMDKRDMEISDRIYRNEETIFQTKDRVSRLEGKNETD